MPGYQPLHLSNDGSSPHQVGAQHQGHIVEIDQETDGEHSTSGDISLVDLCEEIVESSAVCQDEESALLSQRATVAMSLMIDEICASVPQMTDCEGAARSKLPANTDASIPLHGHTLSHFLDNYILIYALYVAGWSRSCQTRQRAWIIAQLVHIGEHFRVREAALVAKMQCSDGDDALFESCGRHNSGPHLSHFQH